MPSGAKAQSIMVFFDTAKAVPCRKSSVKFPVTQL